MLYLLEKIWGKIKIVIGILWISLIRGPLIMALTSHIKIIETCFWHEVCEILTLAEIIGTRKKEEEEKYNKEVKKMGKKV